MANKNIKMSKLRQILKLYASHHQGTRTIRDQTGISRNTVKSYIAHYQTLKTPWDELSKLSDQELEVLFKHEPVIVDPPEREKELYAFFPNAEKRLKQTGMTLEILWKAYYQQYEDAYQISGFYKHYRIWKGRTHPSMRMIHKAGDKMFVDYAGETLQIIEPLTGEIIAVEVFVAILGASQLTYVEAVESQRVVDFITACENALHFFSGAPAAIVPDNLKSAVTKSNRYEPHLNDNFEAFADHYGMVVLPARAYKPKDKSLVESAVKFIYNRIYTNLYGQEFTSLALLNQAIRRHLENHNLTCFQGINYSRMEQFNEMEKQTLQPLPGMRFEMRETAIVTVMKDGYVCLHCDKHYYSVPHQHIKNKVKIFYSKSRVDIYFKYELIATHIRDKRPHNCTTVSEHQTSYHRQIAGWDPVPFVEQAYKIHNDVGAYIEQVILRKSHREQKYKSCKGILSLAKRSGHERLIRACQRANQYGAYNYRIIESILKNNHDLIDIEEDTTKMPTHDNIRGEDYYK